ncbi:hypothetical protein BKA69DRAFT_161505 [Paraphysoderma sedebokerense]|nr:hypothetical protein BKA69DRAFT_161505 [Paraphysoderma sedebokerense]
MDTNNAKNRTPVVIEDSEDDHEFRNNSNLSTRGSTPVERIESKVKPKKSGRSIQTVLAFGEDRRDPIQVDDDNDDELQPKVSKKSSKKKPPVVQSRTHQTRLSAKRSLSDLVSMNCSAIFIGRKIQDKNCGLKFQVDLKEGEVKMTVGKLFKAFSAKDIRCIYYDISGAHSNCISIHLNKQPSDLPVDNYSYDVGMLYRFISV